MNTLIAIDGNSLVNRAYYALPEMSNREGVSTNAVYGFLITLFNFIDINNASHICVAFDRGSKTFRHRLFSEYKSNRGKMHDNLYKQLVIVHEILDRMNILQLSYFEYEADDIIGTISKMCDEVSLKCNILSGDRDFLQLVSNNTEFTYISTKNHKSVSKVYVLQSIQDEFGVQPYQLIDVKALMGDKSDCIPGVPGIGEKTALELIRKYHDLDNLCMNSEHLKMSLRQKLEDHMKSLYNSRRLAEIYRNIDIKVSLDDFKITDLNVEPLKKILKQLELNSIIRRLESQKWKL